MDYISASNDAINQLLTHRSDYGIQQINGQRIYHLKDEESLPSSQKGSEVFVGRLPRNCYEDELVPLFEQFGPIRRVRLLMDFSGTNRGYAFIQYMSSSVARQAATGLNDYEIRPNQKIAAMISWDKCRLFIGGIPRYKRHREVLNELHRLTDGVKEVTLQMSGYNTKNRGFCFVEYHSHYEAAMARRTLTQGIHLWHQNEIRVDWADPVPDMNDEVMKQVKILYVRNIRHDISEDDLKEVFTFGGLHIERVKKIRDFAFVHYETREETEIALESATDQEFDHWYPSLRRVEVSLARPKLSGRRKRAVSAESMPTNSSNSGSTPGSVHIFAPPNPPHRQLTNELKYYQNIFNPGGQNQMLPVSPYNPSQVPVQMPFNPYHRYFSA